MGVQAIVIGLNQISSFFFYFQIFKILILKEAFERGAAFND